MNATFELGPSVVSASVALPGIAGIVVCAGLLVGSFLRRRNTDSRRQMPALEEGCMGLRRLPGDRVAFTWERATGPAFLNDCTIRGSDVAPGDAGRQALTVTGVVTDGPGETWYRPWKG